MTLVHGPALEGKLYGAAFSHVGGRPTNEDSFVVVPALGLFAVADGMGGHAAGEVASRLAVEMLAESLGRFRGQGVTPRNARSAMHGAMHAANARVFEEAQAPARRNMGTTLSALLFAWPLGTVGHVGDSRIYRLRQGSLEQRTKDHTLLAEWIATGRPPEQGPPGHIVSQALGTRLEVAVDSAMEPVCMGDRWLLCSDGLTGALTDLEIAESLGSPGPVEQVVKDLVMRAVVDRRAADNVTALLVHVEPEWRA
jgi:serine/threonine protein phosphatase PrpC